jgi:hypothetical protein
VGQRQVKDLGVALDVLRSGKGEGVGYDGSASASFTSSYTMTTLLDRVTHMARIGM